MQVMIRYKLSPDDVKQDLELLRDVFDELDSVQPEGLRYATFQLDDEVTFVSFVELAEGPQMMRHLQAFQRYRATLDARCAETPVTTVLREVGAYRFH